MKRQRLWDLYRVKWSLKRLHRRLPGPDLRDGYQEAQQEVEGLLRRLPPVPVSADLVAEFDGHCLTYATSWKRRVHAYYRPILAKLDAYCARVRPYVDREAAYAEDLRAILAERRRAVTDALYRVAADDGLRPNPLRDDPRHGNPPGGQL